MKPDFCFSFESLALQDYNKKAPDDEPAMVPCLDIEALHTAKLDKTSYNKIPSYGKPRYLDFYSFADFLEWMDWQSSDIEETLWFLANIAIVPYIYH